MRPQMHLCRICQDAVLQLHPHSSSRQLKRTVVFSEPRSAAAYNQCWICVRFAQWVEKEDPATNALWTAGPLKASFRFDTQAPAIRRIRGHIMEASMFGIRIYPSAETNSKSQGCPIRCLIIPQPELPRNLQAHRLPLRMGHFTPFDQFSLLLGWVASCDDSHTRCHPPSPVGTWYPTRLIKVEDGGQRMRLILTADHSLDERYMTLSYRRDDHQYGMLTSDTIDQFRESIDVALLPQPFRAAGVFANVMGVNYIWIDALCIQHDEDLVDWRQEASQMHLVYSHSCLTLSATHPFEVDGGGLFPRYRNWNQGPFPRISRYRLNAIAVRRHFHVGRPSAKLYAYRLGQRTYSMIDANIWDSEIEDSPLQAEAWAVQERMLPPRVFHFGTTQFGWECNETSALDTMRAGLPPGLVDTTKGKTMADLMAPREQDPSSLLFRRAWFDMVRRYSRCSLTNAKDKLIAFAGMAKQIESARGDQYLAGLWKSTLVTDLAWVRFGGGPPLSAAPARAPTWSWMSLDGEIHFPPAEPVTHRFVKIRKCPLPREAGAAVFRATGRIGLKGVMLPLDSVERSPNGVMESFVVAGHRVNEKQTGNEWYLDLDEAEEASSHGEKGLQILPLFATKTMLFATIVVQTLDGCCRRAGALWLEVPGRADQTKDRMGDLFSYVWQELGGGKPRALELI